MMQHLSPKYEKLLTTVDQNAPLDLKLSPNLSLKTVKHLQSLKQLIKDKAKRDLEEKSRITETKDIAQNQGKEGKEASKMEVESTNGVEQELHSKEIEPSEEFKHAFAKQFERFCEACKDLAQNPEINWPMCFEKFETQPERLDILINLYYFAGESYYETNSLQMWSLIQSCFSKEDQGIIKDAKKFYQKNLFLFEKWINSDKSAESLRELLKLDVSKLTDPSIYRKQPLTPEFCKQVLKQQSVLLKDYADIINIDASLFKVDRLAHAHADEKIDVVFQNPNLYGFLQDPEISFQEKKQMSIIEYFTYQQESVTNESENLRDDHGMIKFGVNIDIENWKKEMEELSSKVPKEFLWNSEKDVMKYLKHNIKGVNLPQLYMKVEGAWTGGHEENLRLRAININHGPGSSIWYTISAEKVAEFRKIIKRLHNIDIHKDEGLWFADIDTCIKNGIEIQYFVQEPGDIVLLGPGCLHWVRCTGIAINSAWNFCTMDKYQFAKAFERDFINKEIEFKSIIPIKHIALELFLKETFSLPQTLKLYLAEQLAKFYSEELEIYQNFTKIYTKAKFEYEDEGNAVYNCTSCNRETLNFYVYCSACYKKATDDLTLICLGCYEAHLENCKNKKGMVFFFKISPELVKQFQKEMGHLEEVAKKYKCMHKYLRSAMKDDKKRLNDLVEHAGGDFSLKEKTHKKLSTKLPEKKKKTNTMESGQKNNSKPKLLLEKNHSKTSNKDSKIEEEKKSVNKKSDEKRGFFYLSPLLNLEDQKDGEDNTYRIKKKLKAESDSAQNDPINLFRNSGFKSLLSNENSLGNQNKGKETSTDGFFLSKLLEN